MVINKMAVFILQSYKYENIKNLIQTFFILYLISIDKKIIELNKFMLFNTKKLINFYYNKLLYF